MGRPNGVGPSVARLTSFDVPAGDKQKGFDMTDARTGEQLTDNLASAYIAFGEDEPARLNDSLALVPDYPVRVFDRKGKDGRRCAS